MIPIVKAAAFQKIINTVKDEKQDKNILWNGKVEAKL